MILTKYKNKNINFIYFIHLNDKVNINFKYFNSASASHSDSDNPEGSGSLSASPSGSSSPYNTNSAYNSSSVAISAEIKNENENNLNNLETNNLNKTGLLLILSNLSKKVPNRVKFVLKWTIIGIKVFFGSIFLYYLNYLNIFVFISTSLVIFYEILNLYFLNRFINKNMKFSVVLPQFIINWLKELEEATSNDLTIKIVKENSYIHISIYSVIIILISILIWFFLILYLINQI